MNDPSQAEPIVQKMIQMDPSDPANYFALAKIYEDAGNYEQAEATLLKARDARPEGSDGLHAAWRLLQPPGPVRQDDGGARISARPQEPNNPEGYYTIATYYWDKTFRDKTLKEPEKREYIGKGVEATDKAIKIKGDYLEAIVYKGLLLRLQATIEKDRKQQEALLKEADALRDRAKSLQKAKAHGGGRPRGKPKLSGPTVVSGPTSGGQPRVALPTAAALSTLWRAIDRLGLTVKKNRTRRRTTSA